MRWPWQRERRESGGDFADAVVRLIESTAAGTAADSGATAALEAAAGALSRVFASATIEGPRWVREAVSPAFLALTGRNLIRSGQSMHVIRDGGSGIRLVPAASWHWEGSHDPAGWTVRATCYGPSTSTTWHLPASSVVFTTWGTAPGQPYIGAGPTRWAALTARLQAEAERSLADEAAGPLAQLLAVPRGPAGSDGDDTLSALQADIAKARGRAALVETTAAGWDEGRSGAPQRDWMASRLGPSPPDALATVRRDAYESVLAACGAPPALFLADSDGTAQREALRRWQMGTVAPLARLLETELSAKLDAPVRLGFDTYALDMVSRSTVVEKLVKAGVALPVALAAVGMDDG